MRTLRRAWREICVAAVLAITIPFILYELYCGWAYHVIDFPSRSSTSHVTFARAPIEFGISVAIDVVLVLAMLWCAVLLGIRLKTLRDDPPLDPR